MNTTFNDSRLIFVLGPPRCGTSLLATLLGRNPDICSTPESHFFFEIAPQISSINSDDPSMFSEIISSSPRWQDFRVDESVLLNSISAQLKHRPDNQAGAFLGMCEAFSLARGKAYVCEKTPRHLHVAQNLRQLFPRSKAVAIVRDGRDASLSLAKAPWTHANLPLHAAAWSNDARMVRQLEREAPSWLVSIKYEDLLTSPEATLISIHKHLGIPYSSVQLDASCDTSDYTAPSWERGWKEKVGKSLDPKRAYAWRRFKADQRIELLTLAMRRELRAWDYRTRPTASFFSLMRYRHLILIAGAAFFNHPVTRPVAIRLSTLLKKLIRPESGSFVGRPDWDVEKARQPTNPKP